MADRKKTGRAPMLFADIIMYPISPTIGSPSSLLMMDPDPEEYDIVKEEGTFSQPVLYVL